MDCAFVNATGHRAAFNLAGPASRELLQSLTDIDLSEAAFPFLGVREGQRRGRRRRACCAPASFPRWVSRFTCRIDSAGRGVGRADEAPRGVRAFGVEAQRVLRLEKGHAIVAQDTDNLTNPFEAGLGWAVRMEQAVLRRPAQPAHPRAPRRAAEAGRLRAGAGAGRERRGDRRSRIC